MTTEQILKAWRTGDHNVLSIFARTRNRAVSQRRKPKQGDVHFMARVIEARLQRLATKENQ